jgi:hypothetical protein
MTEIYHTPKTKTVSINCAEMKDAYACLKARCDFAEAWDGTFLCHRPKDTLPFGKVTSLFVDKFKGGK